MAEATQQTDAVRAYLEYFRDMGVYEFYRRGEPAILLEETSLPLDEAVHASSTELVVAAVPVAAESSNPLADDNLLDMAKLVSLSDVLPLISTTFPVKQRGAALEAIRVEMGDCTRCPLAFAGRRKIVFGDGDPAARLMFVGEGPGADEDEQGVPFVGRSGQLLTNMIQAMGLSREQVYIANVVKCRPPANRAPEPLEANTCTPFLAQQMDVVRPEVVVALGATAAMYLLGVKQSLMSLRGKWHTVRGAKAVVTYHPAFLLRDPRQKGEAWKDLQMVMFELGLSAPKKKDKE